MKKEDKYSNFFGDSQNYKLHNPLPNPYGLRGNPDTQANPVDQGDGLNGTPDYRSFTGEVQDSAWSNHPGFIGINWGGNKNNCPSGQVYDENLPGCVLDTNIVVDGNSSGYTVTDNSQQSGGGFISGLFGGDGMKTYHSCQNGYPISQRFKRGEQPMGWGTNSANACLTSEQIAQKKSNTWNKIGSIFDSINKGFQTGSQIGGPKDSQQFDPSLNPGGTTITKQAGVGDTSKIIGWVLVAGVVMGLGYMAIKATSGPQPEFYND